MNAPVFRMAETKDLPTIVHLLANDQLGQLREQFKVPLPIEYERAFERIISDPNQELMVVENEKREVIGTLQLTFIPYLTYQGGLRAQIEAVRIGNESRGKGLGRAMLEWAIQRAKKRKAHMVQLTTDKQRPDAISFYERLGFKASHLGMKLHLDK